MDHNFDIDQLIAKRLAAEIDARDDALLEKWLTESTVNRRYFSQMERVWQHSELAKNTLQRPLDVEAALLRTKAKIQQSSIERRGRIMGFESWRLAAAATIALVAAAIWLFQPSYRETSVMFATDENTMLDTLSDGTVVVINQQSTLSAVFSKNARRVRMHGEAYFEVAHNAAKPFAIEVQQVEVTVIGTKFNIDNLSDSTKVVVSVEEGKVRVQLGAQILFLTVGEKATIDCVSGQILRTTLPASGNVKGWFDRRFVFDDVPLSEVLPILEKAYNVHIELKNKNLGKCRLHTDFNDESIDRILEVIAETFPIQIENNNGHYLLDGVGCQ